MPLIEPGDGVGHGQRGDETHLVHFYDGVYPSDSIARFIADSLLAGGAGLVVATLRHEQALRAALGALGIELAAAEAAGRLRVLDAGTTLAQLTSGGRPQLAL